jgi:hypothetical protein
MMKNDENDQKRIKKSVLELFEPRFLDGLRKFAAPAPFGRRGFSSIYTNIDYSCPRHVYGLPHPRYLK